jgi:Ca2+-binding EF-hand superfamily protein
MAALEQVTVQQGPKEAKLLTDLKAMDADGDGKLTFDEMSGFFAATGAPLSDDEFELVVGEMLETCESAQLAAQLAALANSS